jgi:hypothetical protein
MAAKEETQAAVLIPHKLIFETRRKFLDKGDKKAIKCVFRQPDLFPSVKKANFGGNRGKGGQSEARQETTKLPVLF